MRSAKAKGSKGERELIKFFNENEWSAIRAAGSGSSRYPSPDILAGNALRRVAIECKVTKDTKKYISKIDIKQLLDFARHFGAEAWVGVKLASNEWFFIMPEDMVETPTSRLVSIETVRMKGLTAVELLGLSNNNRNI